MGGLLAAKVHRLVVGSRCRPRVNPPLLRINHSRAESHCAQSRERDSQRRLSVAQRIAAPMKRRLVWQVTIWVFLFVASYFNYLSYAKRFRELLDVVTNLQNSLYWPGSEALYRDAVRSNTYGHGLFEIAIIVVAVAASMLVAKVRD